MRHLSPAESANIEAEGGEYELTSAFTRLKMIEPTLEDLAME
jgi:hypothetical protein